MLIIEWLMRPPRAGDVLIVKRTVTNCDAGMDAVAQANGLWATTRSRDHQCPDGFRIVDQDGRTMINARFAQVDDLAA